MLLFYYRQQMGESHEKAKTDSVSQNSLPERSRRNAAHKHRGSVMSRNIWAL